MCEKINKTSIIMCAYDVENRYQRWITSTAIDNIQRYTNRDEYELILVDNEPRWELDTKLHHLEIDKHIRLKKDIGYSRSMNYGFKKSNPDYNMCCFIHNDVFVWEGWLPKLIECLDKYETDIIIPNQGVILRQDVLDSYEDKGRQLDNDAGVMLMTKETFKKTGGWPRELKSIFHDGGFRKKIAIAGLRLVPTRNEVLITHPGTTTCWLSDDNFYKNRQREGIIFNKMERNEI